MLRRGPTLFDEKYVTGRVQRNRLAARPKTGDEHAARRLGLKAPDLGIPDQGGIVPEQMGRAGRGDRLIERPLNLLMVREDHEFLVRGQEVLTPPNPPA